MRPKATACFTAVFAAVLGGCGTVVNCVNVTGHADRVIYGGVRQDVENGTRHLHEAVSGSAPCLSEMPTPHNPVTDFASKSFSAACGVGMLAIDLPVSAVADTLTLPVTVPATMMKKKSTKKRILRRKN